MSFEHLKHIKIGLETIEMLSLSSYHYLIAQHMNIPPPHPTLKRNLFFSTIQLC